MNYDSLLSDKAFGLKNGPLLFIGERIRSVHLHFLKIRSNK